MKNATLSIAPAKKEHLEKIEKIYLNSFPEAERRPWNGIVEPESPNGPELFAITLKYGPIESLLGFVTLWRFPAFTYIEHFAIDEALRGLNTGARVLAMLRKRFPNIVLEVEPPSDDNPMAMRRIDFYRRNGFNVLDYDYIQPSYGPGQPEVPMLIMSTEPAADPAGIERTLRKEVYKVL